MKNINEMHITYVNLSYFTQGETSPTNKELVEDMILQLERLDDNILKNPNNTFLDPCAGTGTFGVVLYNKLLKYHTHEWIMNNMIFMIDIKQVNYDILKKLGFVNVYKKDFLNEEFNMKFDVIVGNPPYQAGNNKGNKLWVKFINKSLKLSDNLCYVVPMSLLTSESKQISDIRKMLNGKKNVFNLTKQDIFNVGEKVVYFTSLQSEINHSEIILPNGDVKKVDDISKRQSVNVNDNIKLSIFSKIESYPEKNDYVYDFNRNSNQTTPKRLINKGLVSETQDDTFKYIVHHSASKILYSRVLVSEYSKDNETTYGKLKVVLNYSGGFVGEKYMFLSRNMIGKQMFGIIVDNEEQGNNLINIYSSKLFSWYIGAEKSGGFNSGIYKLPKMDNTKSWTDNEIYRYFNLTDKEIEYIESYGL